MESIILKVWKVLDGVPYVSEVYTPYYNITFNLNGCVFSYHSVHTLEELKDPSSLLSTDTTIKRKRIEINENQWVEIS